MPLTRGRGVGGYIRVENALLIWGAYIRGSLYTGEGGGGLFTEFYGISQWQTKNQLNYNVTFMYNLNVPETNIILTLLKTCCCNKNIDNVVVTQLKKCYNDENEM